MSEREFTSALGLPALTPLYDIAIRSLTRENTWRRALLEQISPTSRDRILDVGCGTGSLAISIKTRCPGTDVHGIDPDQEVLQIAAAKAEKKSVSITLRQGFLNPESAAALGQFSKVVSSLVLHQTPLEEKRNILRLITGLLQPGGSIFIADYGLQGTALMRLLFRSTVQFVDGVANTQPNAQGCIPTLMEDAGFTGVSEVRTIPTLTGSISVYTGRLET